MNTCIICGGEMKQRKSWLRRCPSCGFLFSALTPGAGTGIDGLDQLRRLNFETLLDRLEKYAPLPGKNILEPGCSAGLFLDAAARRGARVTGIEPEKEKADIGRSKGLTIIDGFFPGALAAARTFDVIVFNDVFEHLPDPAAAVRACSGHLQPGGILVLNLPDSGGVLYRIAALLDRLGASGPFDRLWQKGFPSPHISYFNRRNLARLVESATPLRLIHTSALKTIEPAGLKDRIASSYAGPLSSMIYMGLRIFLPLQAIFPADITLQFYRKPA